MSKKTKEGKIDLYYLNSEENKKKKTRAKKNSPSNNKNKKREKNKQKEDNDTFNFDNEIVIGINVIPDNKKNNSKKEKNKKKNRKNTKKSNNSKNKNNGNNSKLNEQQEKEVKKKKEKKVRIVDEDKYNKAKKRVFFILKLIISLLLLTGVGVFFATSPMFNIKNINVYGNEHVSTEQIISLSQIQLETNIYKLLLPRIEENIKENAYIESVKISRKLPNEINIEVVERTPQYMLKFGNAYVYLSSQGYILEISEEKLNVPIITGYTTKEEDLVSGNRLNQEDLKKLDIVLKITKAATSNEIYADISEINITDINNFILIMPGKDKTAQLGDSTSLDDKIAVLKQMVIKNEGIKGTAFLMDINKMYFKKE